MLPSTRARVGAGVGVRWGNMRRTVKHDLPTAGTWYEDEEKGGER